MSKVLRMFSANVKKKKVIRNNIIRFYMKLLRKINFPKSSLISVEIQVFYKNILSTTTCSEKFHSFLWFCTVYCNHMLKLEWNIGLYIEHAENMFPTLLSYIISLIIYCNNNFSHTPNHWNNTLTRFSITKFPSQGEINLTFSVCTTPPFVLVEAGCLHYMFIDYFIGLYKQLKLIGPLSLFISHRFSLF